VNALPHIFSAWQALQRIKPPDPVTLVRPIEILHRCRVVDPIASVAQPLSLDQPGFAPAQRFLSVLERLFYRAATTYGRKSLYDIVKRFSTGSAAFGIFFRADPTPFF
jgi:hypothetical protein